MKKLLDYLTSQLDNPWFWGIVVLTLMAIAAIVVTRSQIKKALRSSVYSILTPPRKSKFWDLFRKKGSTPTGTATPATPPTPTIREQFRKLFSLFTKWVGKKAKAFYKGVKAWRRLQRMKKLRFKKSLKCDAKFLNGNLTGRFFVFKMVTCGIVITPFVILFRYFDMSDEFHLLWMVNVPLIPYFVSIWITYLGTSMRTLGVDEIGGISFYGMPIWNLKRGSGPKLVLIGLFQFGRVKGGIYQIELPGEPENVWKKTDAEFPGGLAKNGRPWVRPIRLPTASPETADYSLGLRYDENGNPTEPRYTKESLKNEILHKQLFIENNGTVRWQVEDDEYFYFVRNFLGSFKGLVVQLRDAFESALKKSLSRRTPAMVIADRDKIDQEGEREVKEIFEGKEGIEKDPEARSGVRFLNLQYLQPDMSHDIAIALKEAAEAGAKAEKTITDSEAAKKAKMNENTGKADEVTKVGNAKNKVIQREYEIRTGDDKSQSLKVTEALAYQENDTVEVFAPGGDGKILVKHGN